tara:strand:- start:248 stop:409 length:162 start_codon:yes stop_codon:yes gene_type:complete
VKNWKLVVFSLNMVKSKIWRAEVSLISIARETKWTNAKERNIAKYMARLPQMT